jgi:aquaporin Z
MRKKMFFRLPQPKHPCLVVPTAEMKMAREGKNERECAAGWAGTCRRSRGTFSLIVFRVPPHFGQAFRLMPTLMPDSLFAMNRSIPIIIVEAIGTFFLALVAINAKGNFAPLAIGSTLMVMIYAGAHISGGHYNPAVTSAVLLRGKLGLPSAIMYWAAQFGAALLVVIVGLILREKGFKAPDYKVEFAEFMKMVLAEILGTFALAYTVLNVATVKKTEGNQYFGLAIGFTVMAMASALPAGMNPAVVLAASILQEAPWQMLFSCLIGSVVGAGLAAIVVNILQGEKTQMPSMPAASAYTPPPPPPPPVS